jgi:hypothetical protein
MYAVFTVVHIDRAKSSIEAATEMLYEEIIPGVKQAPGFVRGTWFGNQDTGHGLLLFETEEQAGQGKQAIGSVVADGVDVVSSDVYEVHAEA